jgi:predicted nucleic acid-binding protein
VRYLLDTCVVSELRRRARCDRALATWYDSVPDDALSLSVLVVGEIRRGIESVRRRDAAAAVVLDQWVSALVANFGDRILPVDQRVAEAWGRLSVPDPLPPIDGLLAATAIVHDLTLVTRNVGDVARTGVRVLNPFAE